MEKILEDTINEIDQICVDFLQKENNAFVRLPIISSEIQRVFEFLIGIFSENEDEESKKWIENVKKYLSEYANAIEKKDTIGIFDTLLYKVKPILEDIKALI